VSLAIALAGNRPTRVAHQGQAEKAQRCENCAALALTVRGAIRTEDLGRMATIRNAHRVEAGETFVGEGEAATHFFNITEGSVKVYKLMPDGRRQITGFFFAGDLLGLAVNDTYTYSAEALTSVTVCQFSRRSLERLLDEFQKMGRRLLAIASNELAAAQEQMMLLGRKTAQERIASFLLMLAGREERNGRSGDVLRLTMTRTDIADYLGLTTETASRVFTSFKKRGWIELEAGNRVILSDRATLEELATGIQ
jgi:CRP/FNR family transcriptional regulator, anaerobic regulatory protein